MPLVTKPNTFTAGGTIIASEHNANFDTLYNLINGLLDATNLAPGLALPDTQLAQITTASKVSGSALTGLSSIPSGAGVIPTVNLGSGTADNTVFLRGDQTWAGATTTVSNALSGSIIQTVNTIVATSTTGTTTIPNDDTIPQNTEGDEYMTLAITPNNASNALIIDVLINTSNSSNSDCGTIALFQDSTANALATAYTAWTAGRLTTTYLRYYMAAGTTSSTTFKIRAGGQAGTVTFNGIGGSRTHGGVSKSSITIMEIKA